MITDKKATIYKLFVMSFEVNGASGKTAWNHVAMNSENSYS